MQIREKSKQLTPLSCLACDGGVDTRKKMSAFKSIARLWFRGGDSNDGLILGAAMKNHNYFEPNTVYEIEEINSVLTIKKLGKSPLDEIKEGVHPNEWNVNLPADLLLEYKEMFLTKEEYTILCEKPEKLIDITPKHFIKLGANFENYILGRAMQSIQRQMDDYKYLRFPIRERTLKEIEALGYDTDIAVSLGELTSEYLCIKHRLKNRKTKP